MHENELYSRIFMWPKSHTAKFTEKAFTYMSWTFMLSSLCMCGAPFDVKVMKQSLHPTSRYDDGLSTCYRDLVLLELKQTSVLER